METDLSPWPVGKPTSRSSDFIRGSTLQDSSCLTFKVLGNQTEAYKVIISIKLYTGSALGKHETSKSLLLSFLAISLVKWNSGTTGHVSRKIQGTNTKQSEKH